MLGDPGVGKTFAAQYIAQETNCPFESTKATDLMVDVYVGTYARNTNILFKRASEKAKKAGRPTIVFIDEADAVLADRQQSDPHQGHSHTNAEILNTLFPLMDGDKTVENVIVILASNMPLEFFDKALKERTKRITHIIRMDFPDEAACLAMLRDAANRHPQTKHLLLDAHAGIFTDLAHRAHANHFTPDNLYGLIDQAVRTTIAQARRAISDSYKAQMGHHPENPQIDNDLEIQKRLAMREAQRVVQVPRELLEHEFDIIKSRRPPEQQVTDAPAASQAGTSASAAGVPPLPGVQQQQSAPSARAAELVQQFMLQQLQTTASFVQGLFPGANPHPHVGQSAPQTPMPVSAPHVQQVPVASVVSHDVPRARRGSFSGMTAAYKQLPIAAMDRTQACDSLRPTALPSVPAMSMPNVGTPINYCI